MTIAGAVVYNKNDVSNEVGEGLVRSLEPATEKTSLFLTKISSFSGRLSCLDVLIVSQNAGKRKHPQCKTSQVLGKYLGKKVFGVTYK